MNTTKFKQYLFIAFALFSFFSAMYFFISGFSQIKVSPHIEVQHVVDLIFGAVFSIAFFFSVRKATNNEYASHTEEMENKLNNN